MSLETLLPYFIEWAAVIGLTLLASTSRRFKHPRVTFNRARREALGALILGGFALLISAGFFFLRPIQVDLSDTRLSQLVLSLIAAALAAIPFAATLRGRKQKLFTAGWLPGMLRPGLLFGIAAGILLIFLAGKFMGILGGLTSPEVLSLAALLGTALLEESIFRGYIQCRLEAWLGPRYGWWLASAFSLVWLLPAMWIFGLLTPLNVLVALVRVVIAGWVMQQTGHVVASTFYRAIAAWLVFLQ